jgi:hypothetical protein
VSLTFFLPLPQEARDYIGVVLKTVQSISKALSVPNKNTFVRVYLLIAKLEALRILVVKLERAIILPISVSYSLMYARGDRNYSWS